MKRFIYFCIAMVLFSIHQSVAAESVFYYYKGEKVYLGIAPKKVLVSFENILQQEEILQFKAQYGLMTSKGIGRTSIFKSEQLVDAEILDNIKNSPLVKYAHNVHYYREESREVYVTDELCAWLDDTAQRARLDSLNHIFDASIVEEGRNGLYLLKMNKFNYDPIQLSCIYFETGFFRACEPKFHKVGRSLGK